MLEHGWTISPPAAAVPGTYCLSCASALRMLDWYVRCVDCGATVESESTPRDRVALLSGRARPAQAHCGICSAERR